MSKQLDELRSDLHWVLAAHGCKAGEHCVRDLLRVLMEATGLTEDDLERLMRERRLAELTAQAQELGLYGAEDTLAALEKIRRG